MTTEPLDNGSYFDMTPLDVQQDFRRQGTCVAVREVPCLRIVGRAGIVGKLIDSRRHDPPDQPFEIELRMRQLAGKRVEQCVERRLRIAKVMKDTRAIDVVELSQTERADLLDGRIHPVDVVELAQRCAPLRDFDARAADLEVYDPAGSASQLLCQEDRPVAGPASRNKDAEAGCEIPSPAKAAMNQEGEVIQPRPNQAFAFVFWIALGERQGLVLRVDGVGDHRIHGRRRR